MLSRGKGFIDSLSSPSRRAGNSPILSATVDALERSVNGVAALDITVSIVTVRPEQNDLNRDGEREHVVDCLDVVASRAEERGVTLIVEPLNTAVNTPGYFLASSHEGFDIVDAVDGPNVKLLYDVYHEQITEGNVIRNLTGHLDRIEHDHVADNPGRHELRIDEPDYENVLGALADAGYEGYVGLEFEPTGDPVSVSRVVRNRFEEKVYTLI